MEIPGLHNGAWDMPDRLNMVAQCLAQPPEAFAIIDPTGETRQDVTHAELHARVGGLFAAIASYVVARVFSYQFVTLQPEPWGIL